MRPVGDAVGAELGREPQREQDAGGQLRVERLRGRDTHLDVAAVGGVEHAVALVDEVALATVDDRHDDRASRPREIDRAVGVGRGSRLRDRHDDRVAHVGRELEARQLGRGQRLDRDRSGDHGLPQHAGEALPGHVRAALTDHQHPPDRPRTQPLENRGREGLGRQAHVEPAVAFDDPAAQGLAERVGRLGHLLEEVVGRVAARDVARRDLRRLQLGVGDRQRAPVVGAATEPGDRAGAARVDHDDLALRCRVPRLEHGLAVEAEVPLALLDHAVRLARDDEAVVADADVERLAAAPQREQDLVRVGAGDGPDRDRALERGDRRAERLACSRPRRRYAARRARG